MAYLFVGAGQAGGALVDAIFANRSGSRLSPFSSDDVTTIGSPLVVNSTVRDLRNLRHVPETNQYGIAEGAGVIEGTTPGFEEQVTGGFGRDPTEADRVMSEHSEGLEAAFDSVTGPDEEIQFAFLFLGLGGGTGCGIAPHIARRLTTYTQGRVRTIAIAVLPNTTGTVGDDGDGVSAGRQSWNARYGLDRLESEVDGIVLVDNQRVSLQAAMESQFAEYNEYVATGIHDLIVTPVLNSIDPSTVEGVDTPDIDVKDIVTALSFGVGDGGRKPGYAALGRSVTMTKSLPGYLLPLVGNKTVDGTALSRLATRKATIADAPAEDATKGITLVRAPGNYVRSDSKGIQLRVIKEFLEGQCSLSEHNVGVSLHDRNLASVTTLLTYRREELDRLREIDEMAERYEAETEAIL